MALLAVAFRDQVAAEKIENIFEPDPGWLFACSIEARCPRCDAHFITVFHMKDSADNPQYLKRLVKMITEDCKGNKDSHPTTYQLTD